VNAVDRCCSSSRASRGLGHAEVGAVARTPDVRGNPPPGVARAGILARDEQRTPRSTASPSGQAAASCCTGRREPRPAALSDPPATFASAATPRPSRLRLRHPRLWGQGLARLEVALLLEVLLARVDRFELTADVRRRPIPCPEPQSVPLPSKPRSADHIMHIVSNRPLRVSPAVRKCNAPDNGIGPPADVGGQLEPIDPASRTSSRKGDSRRARPWPPQPWMP